MKGGKDEARIGGDGGCDKTMGPMFPRLHVNDTEKGGPRAPPRNKMALYEQLSVPAQKSNSFSSLSNRDASNSVLSASSSQVSGHDRSAFPPLRIPQTLAYSSENNNSCSSDVMNINAAPMEFDRRPLRNNSYKTPIVTGQLSSTNQFTPNDLSDSKASSGPKFGVEDDFMVPNFGNSGTLNHIERVAPSYPLYPGCSTRTVANSTQNGATVSCNSPFQALNAPETPSKFFNLMKFKCSDPHNLESENNRCAPKSSLPVNDHMQQSVCNMEVPEKNGEVPTKHMKETPNQDRSSGLLNRIEKVQDNTAPGCTRPSAGNELRCSSRPEVRDSGDISWMMTNLGSGASPRSNNRSPNGPENYREQSGDNTCESQQLEDGNRNDDASETSMVDSISGLEISPDDVVGVIGQKHFWKARRAIVQKLIAASPRLLLEDSSYLQKPPPKAPPKKLNSDYAHKPQPVTRKPKEDAQKCNQNSPERPNENQPTPSGGLDQGILCQASSYGPFVQKQTAVPPPNDGTVPPWYFHLPTNNQWLIPIMSPSEGLVYKPYSGMCPPSAYIAPTYGGPLALPPMAGDFTNQAYGLPTSHQHAGIQVFSGASPSYFPAPNGLSVMNPVPRAPVHAAGVVQEVVGPTTQEEVASRHDSPAGNQGATRKRDPPAEVQQDREGGGFNTSSDYRSEAFSCSGWKVQGPRETEIQGSTASSPCEGGGERTDALPLFLRGSAVDEETPQERRGVVIRVVPHNARSATESAARIFQSIQEGRQQYDS
ncbi:hypothetical protein AMTRI_Chr05g59750 [Amborella trichopoda]